ncbi:CoA transferase subunit A [Ornithinimicrobium cryptoxanthini]|uniref:CoA transferase subunit A n=1 Tax=Ornithinimicrobium cryptoxanthini TaxID=2934161 RepID=UPI00211874CC|nr:CoA-transferase [Ornithinimicrobium cryptoxanthini]
MKSKVMSLSDAVATHVQPGTLVALEGFGHLNPVAAAMEIVRQRIPGLTIAKLTCDFIVDQLIAAECLDVLITSFAGNSSGGSLPELRRSAEGCGRSIELSEFSHGGMVGRYVAGAWNMPFFPLRSYNGSDIPKVNPQIRVTTDPYSGDDFYCVPPLQPDVTIIHAQRADEAGNVQAWGILGIQAEAAFAAREVIVTVEEIVDADVIRSDPNRTIIPSHVVTAVVPAPLGAYPASCQGYYDRDDREYRAWSELARDAEAVQRWIRENVDAYASHDAYLADHRDAIMSRIGLENWMSQPVDYGRRLLEGVRS